MPDIYGINYNGVKPRPTFEELIHFVYYPVRYPDRSATFTRESPLLTQFDGIVMMELQEQEQRENAERQKDDMIRQIAAATLQSAQMLRALNRRRFNTPPDSLADSINQDVDEVHIQQQEEEQRRLNDERLIAKMAELEREWFGHNYDPSQFAANYARLFPPDGSLPPVPTGSGDLQPVPTGSGDLARPLSPQQPLQHVLLTIEELEQADDELLNFEMLFRNSPFIAESTRQERIRLIIQK